jgi:hypothetical protein
MIGGLLSGLFGPAQRLQQPGGILGMAGNGYPGAGPFPVAPQQQHTPAQTPGSAFGQRFRNFMAPESAMPIAAALLTGRSNAEGIGNAFAVHAAGHRQNKTKKFIQERFPHIGEMVEAGLSPSDAFTLALQERKLTQAEKPKREYDDYGFPISGAISQKVRALKLQGFDDQTALGIASGRYQVSVNPMTGDRVMIDAATQEIVPLRQPGQDQSAQAGAGTFPANETGQASGRTLYDMADDATGASSTVRRGIANTVGQLPGAIGELAGAPEQIEADQEYQLFTRDLIRSLSLNPRFPVAEMQRIEGLVPRGALTAPGTTRAALSSLDRELSRIEEDAARWANDPNSPVEQRQLDQQTVRAVRQARERIGIAKGGSSQGDSGTSGQTSGGLRWSLEP